MSLSLIQSYTKRLVAVLLVLRVLSGTGAPAGAFLDERTETQALEALGEVLHSEGASSADPAFFPTCPAAEYHEYVDGICKHCGQPPVYLAERLPDRYFEDAQQRGTVVKADVGYVDVHVYLPYGYDENAQYNVMIIMPNRGGSADYTIDSFRRSEQGAMSGQRLFDHMIEDKLIQPTIFVSFALHTLISFDSCGRWLRMYLLPYLGDNFATYAEDGSIEALQAAREHFGIGGYSFGAFYLYNDAMQPSLDLFGSFFPVSGGDCESNKILLQEGLSDEYRINCYYLGVGGEDGRRKTYRSFQLDVIDASERLVDGENAFYVEVSGGHTYYVFFLLTFNALQLMFQETSH